MVEHPTLDDTAAMLRSVGLRATRPRVAVLNALAQRPHSDVETLTTVARKQLGTVSTQAVYDVLKALVRTGLARQIEPAGHPTRFETRVGDNHHHLICRQCGLTQDINCVVGSAPCLDPEDEFGFHIDEAEVIFWGICGACRLG